MKQADEVQNDPYDDFFENPGKDAFARLFSAEVYFMVPQTYLNDGAKIVSRNSAIQLIEKIYPRTTYAFDHLIPYTAITYFDRFYSQNDEFPRVIQTNRGTRNRTLFAICCLTIAWKLRSKHFLLEFFLREKNLWYSTENVLEMELEICRGLGWRMRSVTPFLFVGFFFRYLQLPLDRSSFHDLIYISQRDIAFAEYRPSVIAASAMLAVASGMVSAGHSNYLLGILTREVELLKPLENVIEQSTIRLVPLYKPTPDIDKLPTEPAPGPGPSSHQITNIEPGQTSASSSETLSAAETEERPSRRPGKEHVTEFGQIQQGDQKEDPNAVTKKVDTSASCQNDQALEQDAVEIQAAAAEQDDHIIQITEQVGEEEAKDPNEKELALANKSDRTSIKNPACCTCTCSNRIAAICNNIKNTCNIL